MKPREASKADLRELAHASCDTSVTLRANGLEITSTQRDELLERCASGAYVELDVDILAFEQRPGVSNRNFVRFRDGGLLAMGRSGVGTPFLRDHADYSALARGGTITASQTEKRGEGDYAIRQTAKLTAPWAVELALRGLLSTVSIAWNASGAPPTCTVCNTNFFRCSHMPGQRYTARDDGAGGQLFMPDPAGALVCERMYSAAVLTETSGVNVPAVPTAHIEAIRAALAHNSGEEPHGDEMPFPKLLAVLGLAATAGEAEVMTAVDALKADQAELKVVKTELGAANTELGAIRASKRKSDEDRLFADTIARGAMAPGGEDEKSMREFYAAAPERAAARLAARPDNSVTPVGAPRQSGGAPPPAPPIESQAMATVEARIVANGGTLAGARNNLIRSGFTPADADKMLIATYGGGGKAA